MRASLRSVGHLVFVSTLVLTGCAAEPPATGTCTTSRDCTAGDVCLDGACVASPLRDGGTGCGADCECTSDLQCASSVAECVEAACVDGSCFFRARDERCGGSRCDIATGCEGTSDAGTAIDAAVELDGGAPVDAATTDASVRDASTSDGGARDAGLLLRDSGALRAVGSACADATECAPVGTMAPLCLAEDGTPPMPGGYCSATCTFLVTTSCGRDAACVRIGSDLRAGHCLDICTSDTDCRTREGYRCTTSGSLTTARVCMPAAL